MSITRMKFALLTCVATAALAACATAPAPTSAIEFNYTVDNGRATGIVQVFDLSGNTVVQMRDLDPKATQFLDARNAVIPYKVMGQNIMLAGMHPTFTVSTPAAASRVVRKGASSFIGEPATPGAATNGLSPQNDPAIAAEIGRIRKEIAELKTILAAASAREKTIVTAEVAQTPSEPIGVPGVVIVSFANNSPQFNPAEEQQSQLRAIAQAAEKITVRGFTDSDQPSAGSTALAKARAEAARRYLVAMGVTPKKITVGFVPAGRFIAENRSPAGKAANRRVEIGGT